MLAVAGLPAVAAGGMACGRVIAGGDPWPRGEPGGELVGATARVGLDQRLDQRPDQRLDQRLAQRPGRVAAHTISGYLGASIALRAKLEVWLTRSVTRQPQGSRTVHVAALDSAIMRG
jgi:hypothetical protein